MKAAIGKKQTAVQKQYQKDIGKKVSHQPDIKLGQEVFILYLQIEFASGYGDKLAGK